MCFLLVFFVLVFCHRHTKRFLHFHVIMGLEQTWNTTDPLFGVIEVDISLLLGKKRQG